MSGFKANNKMTAKELFDHRSIYSGFAFSEAGEVNVAPESTKNFWFVEHLFYGRIREKSGVISIISPKPEFFKSCKKTATATTAQALDFVVDAFENLRLEFEKDKLPTSRDIDGGTHLSKLIVHAGASDSLRSHKKAQKALNETFLSYASIFKSEADNIFSFEAFVPFFMEFLMKSLELTPVTRSSYLIGKSSSPMMSGLCLEIAPLDHSDNQKKSKFFLDNESFNIYRTLAAASGFAIDKNAPWRLVADIASKQMLEFAAKRVPAIATAEDVLDYYFEDTRSATDEFEEFKRMMVRAYNLFVISNPVVSRKSIENNSTATYTFKDSETGAIWNGPVHYNSSMGYMGGTSHTSSPHPVLVREVTITSFKKRTRESFDIISARLGNEFWYDKFIRAKNVELNLGYSEQEIVHMTNSAADLEKSLDRSKATGYLNKRMTPIVASEGSLVYEAAKLTGGNGSAKKDAQAIARGLNKLIY